MQPLQPPQSSGSFKVPQAPTNKRRKLDTAGVTSVTGTSPLLFLRRPRQLNTTNLHPVEGLSALHFDLSSSTSSSTLNTASADESDACDLDDNNDNETDSDSDEDYDQMEAKQQPIPPPLIRVATSFPFNPLPYPLPDDLTSAIFRLFSTSELLNKLARVSKNWSRLAAINVEILIFKTSDFPDETAMSKKLMELFKRHWQVKQISLVGNLVNSMCTVPTATAISLWTRSLRKLSLSKLNLENAISPLCTLRALTSLKIHTCLNANFPPRNPNGSPLPKLRSLSVHGGALMSPDITLVCKYWPELTELSVKVNAIADISIIAAILTELRVLHLETAYVVNNGNDKEAIKEAMQLPHLEDFSGPGVADCILGELPQGLATRLKRLKIFKSPLFTQDGLRKVYESFKALRSLQVSFATNTGGQGIIRINKDLIKKFTSLEHLRRLELDSMLLDGPWKLPDGLVLTSNGIHHSITPSKTT